MDCKYHIILESLHAVIWERIDIHYIHNFFQYWLGDQSNLGGLYKEIFEEILEEPLTDIQISLLEKKGENLETIIGKWSNKWKENNPEVQNQQLPKSCLKIKIYEYLIYQLNKQDIREIIGNYC
jgi:hypothetical protein